MLEGGSGVSVNTGSGIPVRQRPSVYRGMGLFNASNSPLYVGGWCSWYCRVILVHPVVIPVWM